MHLGNFLNHPPRRAEVAKMHNEIIHYADEFWEYEGFKWLKGGILCLELQLLSSNEKTTLVREIALVREIDVHRDNPGLPRLWFAIGRPEPENGKYEPLRILEKTKNGRFRVQWTGFDEKSATLESVKKMRRIAPELVKEYWNTHIPTKRPKKHPTKRPANVLQNVLQNAQSRCLSSGVGTMPAAALPCCDSG